MSNFHVRFLSRKFTIRLENFHILVYHITTGNHTKYIYERKAKSTPWASIDFSHRLYVFFEVPNSNSIKGMYYMDTADTAAEYSERRPRGQAWRVCQSGSVTYADSRDAALRSHKAKLAALAEAESLLRAAAIASNSGK